MFVNYYKYMEVRGRKESSKMIGGHCTNARLMSEMEQEIAAMKYYPGDWTLECADCDMYKQYVILAELPS